MRGARNSLTIAKGLSLPTNVVTQTVGFIGRKGSGKTYAAGKLVELVHGMGAPAVVLDCVGNWWGLRLAADGKKRGLSIPVFGGAHGDVPLTPDAGNTLGRLIVERRFSAVLDVSQFRKNERRRFVTSFAEELFHRSKAVREPLLVVFEEAQVFAPQQSTGEEAMLGAVEDIVRLGRNYGLGSVLITQRPQSVNKEVLNQVEALFVGQLSGAHERKAIQSWIVATGAEDAEGYVGELPSLEVGEMFAWSPQWLRVFKRVRIARKKTFDASATPELGKRRRRFDLAPVDVKKLGKELEEAVERAKAEDPKLLRAEVKKLQKALKIASDMGSAPAEVVRVPVSVFTKADLARLEKFERSVRSLGKSCNDMTKVLATAVLNASRDRHIVGKHVVGVPVASPRASKRSPELPSNGASEVGKGGLRRILLALAQRPQGLSAKQLGVRAMLSSRSGTFSTYLGKARAAMWIQGDLTRFVITERGREALGPFEPLPEGAELLQHWLRELGSGGITRMLTALADAYPDALSKPELGAKANISSSSGTFSTYLSKLRKLQLVEASHHGFRLSEELVS